MSVTWARWLVTAVELYLGIGLAVAVPFVVRGVDRLDPQAARGSWGFRLAILPGCCAFWPLVARRWRRRAPPPEERNAHRLRAGLERP